VVKISHIAKFALQINDEAALRKALERLGCTIFEGQMKQYGGSWAKTVPSSSYNKEVIGKEIEFGFSFQHKGRVCDRFGFVKNDEGNYCLVGDSYGYGIRDDVISNILENMYVDSRVDLNVVPMLESLGFVEDMSQTEANLQTFA
jgi:hypothetical protein